MEPIIVHKRHLMPTIRKRERGEKEEEEKIVFLIERKNKVCAKAHTLF
jgi:hypothetical protein